MPAADIPPNNNSKGANNSGDVQQRVPYHAPENDFLANESAPTLPTEKDEEWVTVDFPNAISVDSIPVSDEIKTEELTHKNSQKIQEEQSFIIERSPGEESTFSAANSTEEETKEPATIIQALHECNRDLVKRVTELESSLEECREKWQNTETLLKEKTEELTVTQKQVSRLFYKLEACNEIIQRQEVLAETLRENWEKSQARQGQLERECALTQQRYNDACYRAMELENSCRELRSRLYRQQRQTLQFKAALERTLEMPTGDVVETTATAQETRGSLVLHPTVDKIVSAIATEPVKPWSAQLHKETPPPKESEKSINLEKQPAREEVSEVSAGETEEANLNLPSFREAVREEESSSGISSQQTVLQYMAEAAGGFPEELIPEEQLWDFEAEATTEMPPIENEVPTIPKDDRISWNLAAGEWNTDKSGGGGDRPVPEPTTPPTETPAAASWSPPTIYPVHSRKKRQSLAAIDLPTFPRNEPPSAANG